jgi:two-component system LytT family sensor kinase
VPVLGHARMHGGGGDRDADALGRAERRLRQEEGFYIHLAVYISVNALLFFFKFRSGTPWWFVWPALGWGIGLALHAFSVFGVHGTRDWEERRLRELFEEERARGQ